jgi:hypothetical protein
MTRRAVKRKMRVSQISRVWRLSGRMEKRPMVVMVMVMMLVLVVKMAAKDG